MALKKIKETNLGVSISYWRVEIITIDKHRQEGSIVLNGYLDENAKEFIESKVVSLNGLMNKDGTQNKEQFEKYFKDETQEYSNIYQACYECAKEADEFFADAEDC